MRYNPEDTILGKILRKAWEDTERGENEKALVKLCLIWKALEKNLTIYGESGQLQKKGEALSNKWHKGTSYGEWLRMDKKGRDKGKKLACALHKSQPIDPIAINCALGVYFDILEVFKRKAKNGKDCPWRDYGNENAKDFSVLAFFRFRAAIAFAEDLRKRKKNESKKVMVSEAVCMGENERKARIKNDILKQAKSMLEKQDQKLVKAWAIRQYNTAHHKDSNAVELPRMESILECCQKSAYNKTDKLTQLMLTKIGEDCPLEYSQATLELAEGILFKN